MIKAVFRRIAPLLIVCSMLASALGVIVAATGANAGYPNGDCDSNAVIRCGVNDIPELKRDYHANQGGNVKAVFRHFGMRDASSFNGMVKGRVTKSGDVWVNGKKVATDAITAGRHNMPGSTPILDGQFYTRSPSVSFRSNSLEAYVKMDGNRFKYAVIMSCGNPVKAKPVRVAPKPKPEPAPKPAPRPEPEPEPEPEPDVKPTFSCDLLTVRKEEDLGVVASVDTTANEGVILENVTYDWGDGTDTTTTDTTSVPHTYTEPGTYNVTATAHFNVNGKEFTDTNINCAKEVVFKEVRPDIPAIEVTKEVREFDKVVWMQEVKADPGEMVEYRIIVKNTGETALQNVVVQDSLPGGVSFTAGNLEGSADVIGFQVSELVGEGVNVGDIPVGESREIRFAVTIGTETEACDVSLRNVAHAIADNMPEDEDDALVKVCQPDAPVREVPVDVEPEPTPPQVKGEQAPVRILPETGAASAFGIFSVTSILGTALYKLKEFFSSIL